MQMQMQVPQPSQSYPYFPAQSSLSKPATYVSLLYLLVVTGLLARAQEVVAIQSLYRVARGELVAKQFDRLLCHVVLVALASLSEMSFVELKVWLWV
jgi:hypothetical protein